MSISFDAWYHDYSKRGVLKNIQNWEITEHYANLFAEIESKQEVDMNDLIEKIESLKIPLDKLKEAARKNRIQMIGKSDGNYMLALEVEEEITCGVVTFAVAKELEDWANHENTIAQLQHNLELIFGPISAVMEWVAGIFGYNLN